MTVQVWYGADRWQSRAPDAVPGIFPKMHRLALQEIYPDASILESDERITGQDICGGGHPRRSPTAQESDEDVILSHKIQLAPTCKQRNYFARAAGTDRFVWNLALEEWDRQYAAGNRPCAMKLKRDFNATKYERFPWLSGVHRDAHSRAFTRLGEAFQRFFKGQARRPRFHKKGRKDSFYVANDKLNRPLVRGNSS